MRGRHCKARLGVVCNDNERCLAQRLSVPSHDGKGRFQQKRLAPCMAVTSHGGKGPGFKELILDTCIFMKTSLPIPV